MLNELIIKIKALEIFIIDPKDKKQIKMIRETLEKLQKTDSFADLILKESFLKSKELKEAIEVIEKLYNTYATN